MGNSIDREKVIKAVEEAFDLVHSDYIGTYDFDETEWEQNKADAIALLKEQEKPNGKCVNECECWDAAYERGKQDALKEQEKLVDVNALREKLGFAENCENCKRIPRNCQYDSHYSIMDFCERLDMAIEELTKTTS